MQPPMEPRIDYWTNGPLNEFTNVMISILQKRDPYGQAHASGVTGLCIDLAHHIGMTDSQIEILGVAARLHDIGKLAISDSIINKNGPLTDVEYRAMKEHCNEGFQLISAIPTYPEIGQVILYHHECWDGSGYPRGLKGEEIPEYPRMVKICDYFDALIHYRHYRERVVHSVPEALMMLRANEKSFDPSLLLEFIRMQVKAK
jgi:HD-GYP domain-containing protein (c-di-GMP phosphodiesterase class II)